MNARQAKVCPACGVLNRPSWEFCAKCGESLEGAALTTEGEAPAADAPSKAPVSGGSSVVVLGVTLVAVAVFAALAWRYAQQAPPPSRPDPAMFTIATLPPELPEAPAPSTPGVDAFNEGRRLIAEGDIQGAREHFVAALVADGDNPMYRAAHARALWALGERQQSLEEFRVAARLDPDRQIAYARALDVAGDRTTAVAEYESVLARKPDSPVVHEELGRLLYRSGRYEESAPHLEQASEARPDDPVLKQELAWALDSSGDAEAAAETYREVLEMAPEAAISRGLLADNLFKRGERDEALAVVQEGLELSPDAPLLQRQLGSLLERTGRRAEAAAAYRRYAQIAPNASDAQEIAQRAAVLDPGSGQGKSP
jgi:tetratricopeptide (TPR) repeat protein